MNKTTLFLLGVTFSLTFSACEKLGTSITPADTITTETKNITGFEGIKVFDAFEVFVTFSETEESIEIEANENLHEYIEVFEQSGNLVIKLKDKTNIRGLNTKLNAHITTSDLSFYEVSDASRIELENITKPDQATINLYDASRFNGEINTSNLYCKVSDASEMYLLGIAKKMNLELNDASLFKNYAMEADVLEADLSGACKAYITVNKELSITASDASDFYYKGNCTITYQKTSDASKVHKTD